MKEFPKKADSPQFEQRPWGSFTILDEGENYKVKRLEVFPGKRLSYQRHSRRSEHWFVVRGTAKVTLNGAEYLVDTGEAVDVPVGTAHRIENVPDGEHLVLIETQTGDYFGEDDIERLDDDFGRVS
ncbi:MAG TPA: phosphomannose isomerase type II C-terminal cupin domain [Pyrinomonadaceae bacterium]|jgi:mannose-6-phosphate isomerase-like protein (cupin superfamily)|nr:phosphomannose isomerase type II C-terminal cupin domain [Pyrinomonadaceae bacterium]